VGLEAFPRGSAAGRPGSRPESVTALRL